MMICKADFEELFPHLFRSEPEPEPEQAANEPLLVNRPLHATPDCRPLYGADKQERARGAAQAAMVPATAAYAATWTMLSGYGRH